MSSRVSLAFGIGVGIVPGAAGQYLEANYGLANAGLIGMAVGAFIIIVAIVANYWPWLRKLKSKWVVSNGSTRGEKFKTLGETAIDFATTVFSSKARSKKILVRRLGVEYFPQEFYVQEEIESGTKYLRYYEHVWVSSKLGTPVTLTYFTPFLCRRILGLRCVVRRAIPSPVHVHKTNEDIESQIDLRGEEIPAYGRSHMFTVDARLSLSEDLVSKLNDKYFIRLVAEFEALPDAYIDIPVKWKRFDKKYLETRLRNFKARHRKNYKEFESAGAKWGWRLSEPDRVSGPHCISSNHGDLLVRSNDGKAPEDGDKINGFDHLKCPTCSEKYDLGGTKSVPVEFGSVMKAAALYARKTFATKPQVPDTEATQPG